MLVALSRERLVSVFAVCGFPLFGKNIVVDVGSNVVGCEIFFDSDIDAV